MLNSDPESNLISISLSNPLKLVTIPSLPKLKISKLSLMPTKAKITHAIRNLSKMTKAKSKFLLKKASSNMLPKCMNLKENHKEEISLLCLITT